ncbi:MAG TPA: ABC transporter permease, partial [Blastocatellia bacterium]|nr:ABC transporter permease [Blastocatellia bacterium]
MMDTVVQDLRYGVRTLLKNRAFTAVALLALALGIGANTAIFSVVNAVLLRPLPYAEPDRIMTVLYERRVPVAPADFLDWKEQNQVFENIAAAQYWQPNLTGKDRPEQLWALHLTADMFTLLGVKPALGRTFLPDEGRPGNQHVVVLSHRLWQRRFGGDAAIVGQTITLDGEGYAVIGVMPPGFRFAPFWATRAELWAPLNLAPRASDRRGSSLRVFAKLKPGVTREQAQAEMAAINQRVEQQYPDSKKALRLSVDPLHEMVVGNIRPALIILLGAVSFVLLISCANVANLLMARATARQKEVAVRMALGATRSRLIRQLLTESLLLSLSGGVLGLLLALWGVPALVALGPDNLPRADAIGLDSSVLCFTLATSLLTGLIFGLAPALQSSRLELNESLKEGGRSSTEGMRRNRVRRSLVVAEVALALVLLIGGGLMIRSFARIQAIDPGFNPRNVLTFVVSLAGSQHSTRQQRLAFFDQLLGRIEALPSVQSASAINHLPLAGDVWQIGYTIEGRPAPPPEERRGAVYRIVWPNYFQTMGATIVRGRDFTDHDTKETTGAVIINESFARRHWPAEEPLGKRITITDGDPDPREVVGVVRDLKQSDWTAEPIEEMYLPHLQSAEPRYMTLVVKSASDPAALIAAVQNEVWAIDKNLPVSQVMTMRQAISDSVGQQRFNMSLLGIFAVLALTLAAIGIYGVMSYSVTQRRHEIGIRMALGASQGNVLWMVVKQGMTLAAIGVGLGLAGAFLLTRLMSSLLYGVGATDPLTFFIIPLILTGVALGACFVPARR